MGKIRVVYATMTGHSEKLARAIARALEVEAEDIKGLPPAADADLLFIVGGIYGGQSMPELLQFVGELDAGLIKSAALVTSCASKKKTQQSIAALLAEKGIPVAEEWVCRGSFLFLGLGHPNGEDVNEAVRFARRVAGRA